MDTAENLHFQDNGLFIEAVRSRPSLWDIRQNSYRNQTLRSKAWQEFLGELGLLVSQENIKAIGKRWSSLRYCYSKWKEFGTRSGSSGEKKYFPHSAQMAFLNDSLQTRRSTSLWQTAITEGMEDDHEEERPSTSNKSMSHEKEIIALKKEELNIKRRYVEQQETKKSQAKSLVKVLD
ncbi:PREDICTED: uncharacterized protein LOC108374916 [Rhagoletis zephyria]|uniref:uncharacterized protein LOC108374916 n=1 Tax=Rhagoletis zephyria TaxID=28612 RepID=UPI0008114E84|nr:PREDICTED: uncharacterized protein LOC108374916 [Rhagoletis zephyria]XP_036320491.1 uncharacterized protein LOC118734998 [Rhagoletis pomonella]